MGSAQVSVEEMARRYCRLYTASAYDVLDRMGLPNQCLSLEIKPLRDDMVVAGPAYTVVGSRDPRTEAEVGNPKIASFGVLEHICPHCVIVVDPGGESQCGHWGELMSHASQARGARGVVIDGGIRDGQVLLRMQGWPVFARYTTPVESERRWCLHDFEVPILLSGTLSRYVRVSPGDWMLGDMDGVLVIPKEIALEVLLEAEKIAQTEDLVRDEIRRGLSPKQVFDKYGRF